MLQISKADNILITRWSGWEY